MGNRLLTEVWVTLKAAMLLKSSLTLKDDLLIVAGISPSAGLLPQCVLPLKTTAFQIAGVELGILERGE